MALIGSSLARGITAFEQDDDSCSCLFDPILQVAKLDLQLVELPLVNFAFHFVFGVAAVRSFQCHDVTSSCQRLTELKPCQPLRLPLRDPDIVDTDEAA